MATLKHKDTRILYSCLDFSKIKMPLAFSGKSHISITVSIPTDLKPGGIVRCRSIFTLEQEQDGPHIEVKTETRIEVSEPDESEADTAEACRQIALQELEKKVEKLFSLHGGAKISFPQFKDLVKEDS